MKTYNVYNHYDSSKTVIGKVRPNRNEQNGSLYISSRTYNRLLNNRVVGGTAGIYTDCPEEIRIIDSDNAIIKVI